MIPDEAGEGHRLVLNDRTIGVTDLAAGITPATTTVELSRCASQWWGEIGTELKKHKCLQQIIMLGCDAGDLVCPGISQLKRLKRLTLVGCHLTDRAVDSLVRMASLVSLRLDDNPALTSNSFRRVLQCLRKLESLAFAIPSADRLLVSAAGVGRQQLHFITSNLKNLRTLVIDRNNLALVGARIITDHLPQLENLNVDHNYLGGEGARILVCSLPNLTVLSIDNNKIGDEGAEMVGTALPHLLSLNIDRNLITTSGLQAVCRKVVSLQTLYMRRNNPGIKNLKRLARMLPKAKIHQEYEA